MEKIFGLPAHPFLVHVPVVLLPLGAIGVLLMVLRVTWFERYKWATLIVVGAGTLGAVLAAGSGGAFQDEGRRRVGDHAEAGDAARAVAIVFFVVVLAAVVGPILWRRWSNRTAAAAASGEATTGAVASTQPMWLRIVVSLALVASAAASVITVINAGHSGAEAVWEKENGEGSERRPPAPGEVRDDDGDDD